MKSKFLLALGLGAALAGSLSSGIAHAGTFNGPAGNPWFTNPDYDYAPSLIDVDGGTDVYWCGKGPLSTDTDVIFHKRADQGQLSATEVVLRPTPGTWNRQYVCDPSVVKGVFRNSADGQTYQYAMYYSGADNLAGVNNFVGLAFSNDRRNWVNYPNAVIGPLNPAVARGNYGVGQPATFNSNGQAGLFLFYTDLTGPQGVAGYGDMYVRHTNDGINFEEPVRVPNTTTDGTAFNANSDFGYDYNTGNVYVIGSLPGRNCTIASACAGGTQTKDLDTYQLALARMPIQTLLGGGGGVWESLGQLNTDKSGFYQTHSPGFQRDAYGNISGILPNINIFFSGGTYQAGTWDLTFTTWTPSPDILPLKRTAGPNGHWVTTGYTGPGYNLEGNVGQLFTTRKDGTSPLQSCLAGADHFLSRDGNCENQINLGVTGYIYDQPQANTVLIYRCRAGSSDHFVSSSPSCEGQANEGPLGYAIN